MKMKRFSLSDLDFNNIGAWPSSAKVLAVIVACVAISILGYLIDTQPQLDALEASKLKERDLKQLIDIKAAKAANLVAYQAQMADIQRSFGSLLKQLPSKTEVAELLTDITQTGISSGLEFELFKPMPEIPAEFYVELPIEIKVRGRYHEFGKFMAGLAALPRIVTIHDFKISTMEQKGSKDQLLMEATAKTYRYLDEKEVEQFKMNGK
ncbi:MAG: type 4a pilus biogenesis protein PilO [Gammaproteobacteria bacterium]|nr:type 4a pilus biogenesis protein PilO [Gammaproteobacteria bacterium]